MPATLAAPLVARCRSASMPLRRKSPLCMAQMNGLASSSIEAAAWTTTGAVAANAHSGGLAAQRAAKAETNVLRSINARTFDGRPRRPVLRPLQLEGGYRATRKVSGHDGYGAISGDSLASPARRGVRALRRFLPPAYSRAGN